jgi:hypothetical protein
MLAYYFLEALSRQVCSCTLQAQKGRHTMCTGFSTSLCALNSLFIYSSPNKRMSKGKCLRCALNNRRYRGIGGKRAIGAGLPFLAPTSEAEAINSLGETLIFSGTIDSNCCAYCLWWFLSFRHVINSFDISLASSPR